MFGNVGVQLTVMLDSSYCRSAPKCWGCVKAMCLGFIYEL